MVAPAIFILLLIGIFPLIYSLIVSFQNLTMTEADTSFHGLLQYKQLFKDTRLWWAIAHTAVITAIALPLELVLGYLLAMLFLGNFAGGVTFSAWLDMIARMLPARRNSSASVLADSRLPAT